MSYTVSALDETFLLTPVAAYEEYVYPSDKGLHNILTELGTKYKMCMRERLSRALPMNEDKCAMRY